MKLNSPKLLIVFFALVSLFFSGCEKNTIEKEVAIQKTNKFTDQDYYKVLQQDSFFAGAINDLSNFNDYQKTSNNNSFKIVEGSVRIERGIDYTTYVLLLENQTNKKNYFENIIIQTALNKPTRYLFVKYDLQKSFNNQFIEDPEHGLFANRNIGQLNVIENNQSTSTNKEGCTFVEGPLCIYGGTEHI